MPDSSAKATVAFGDVVRLSRERSSSPEEDGFERFLGLEHLDPGDLKIRRWGDIADGVSFTNVFRPGQVLFGKRRAYQRKVAVADFSGICSSDIYVLEPKGKHLLPELLPYICQSEPFYEYVLSRSQGGLSPRVNWKALAEYQFALPPLDEQRRMVEVLQAAAGLLNLYRALNSRLLTVIRSVLSEIVKARNHPLLPIASFAKFRSGKGITVSKLPKNPDSVNLTPVVGGNGIAAFCTSPMENIPLPVIVIGRVGEYCGSIHYIEQPCWISDNALFVKELDNRIQLRYFEACLRGLNLNSYSVGGAQPLLNQKIIGSIEVPIPDIKTQTMITKQLLAYDSSLRIIESRFRQSKMLMDTAISMALEQHP